LICDERVALPPDPFSSVEYFIHVFRADLEILPDSFQDLLLHCGFSCDEEVVDMETDNPLDSLTVSWTSCNWSDQIVKDVV
jgi:hypothetical protein